LTRIEGEAEAVLVKQALTMRVAPGGNHRQFMLGKLKAETVFLKNLRIAPTSGTVELRNKGGTVFHAHLVDAVLIAVQRQSPAITAETTAFHRIHDKAGSQGLKRMGTLRHLSSLSVREGNESFISRELLYHQ